MILNEFDRVIMKFPVERPINGIVIKSIKEIDGSFDYYIEPRSMNFGKLNNKARVQRINSKDIGKSVKIEIHVI